MVRYQSDHLLGSDRRLYQNESVRDAIFGTYNIQNVRNRELESVFHGMSQGNVNIAVFQETKVAGGVFAKKLSGY